MEQFDLATYKGHTSRALILFLDRFRGFASTKLLDPEKPEIWTDAFYRFLHFPNRMDKLTSWLKSKNHNEYNQLIMIIDYENMEYFVNAFYDPLEKYFHHDVGLLKKWVRDLKLVRDHVDHANPIIIKKEDIDFAWQYMERIARYFNDPELQTRLKAIKEEYNKQNNEDKEIYERKKSVDISNDIGPFDTAKDNYNILILPFRNPDNNNEITHLGSNLVNGLKDKNRLQNLGLEIKYLSSFHADITPEEAKKIGKEYKADMVLWGNDSKPDGNLQHQIYFHYVNISDSLELHKSKEIPDEGKTDRFETDRLIDITEGNLHLEIEDIIYWFLASKSFLKKDYNNALTSFKKIENGKYVNEGLYDCIACCYYYLQFYDKAKAYFEKALKLDPDFSDAHNNYAHLLEKEFNDIEGAKKHYKIALKIDPDDAIVHHNYAHLLEEKFNDIEGAKKHYKIALKIDPDDAIAHFNYAVLLKEKYNSYKISKKHYLKAIQVNPKIKTKDRDEFFGVK